MAGSIRKRGDNSWEVRVFLGRRPDGTQKMQHKTIRGTKKDAQRYLNEVLCKIDQGTWVQPSSQRLSDFLSEWLSTGDTSSAGTAEFNAWVVEKYINPELGSTKLSDLKTTHLSRCYKGMEADEYAPSSIHRIHAVLHSALEYARKEGKIVLNPAKDATLPSLRDREMLVFNAEEARRFLTQAKLDGHSALWALALETGMRPGEYLGLRWRDVDLAERRLMVQRSVVWIEKRSKFVFSGCKTKKSQRRISITPELCNVLASHKRHQAAARLKAGASWNDLDLVFPTAVGTPQRTENLVRRHFKSILKKANLPDIRLYDLRHTMATLLLAKNVNPKIVSERLGHGSVALTLDVYSHVLPDMQSQASEVMGTVLWNQSSRKKA